MASATTQNLEQSEVFCEKHDGASFEFTRDNKTMLPRIEVTERPLARIEMTRRLLPRIEVTERLLQKWR